jgi:hypothetical protein
VYHCTDYEKKSWLMLLNTLNKIIWEKSFNHCSSFIYYKVCRSWKLDFLTFYNNPQKNPTFHSA